METSRRELVILRRRAEAPELDPDGLERFVARVNEEGAPTPSPTLDLPHPSEPARARFGGRFPIEIDALAWVAVGAPLPPDWDAVFTECFRYRVDSIVGWPATPSDDAKPDDVVKQVSLLHAAEGYDRDRFREHYRHHVEIAGRYMPALWQYVQNDVEQVLGDAPEAQGVGAVSELWFRTTDDFLNRYFPSEADQRAFSSHEGFLDLRHATSFVCASARERTGGRGG